MEVNTLRKACDERKLSTMPKGVGKQAAICSGMFEIVAEPLTAKLNGEDGKIYSIQSNFYTAEHLEDLARIRKAAQPDRFADNLEDKAYVPKAVGEVEHVDEVQIMGRLPEEIRSSGILNKYLATCGINPEEEGVVAEIASKLRDRNVSSERPEVAEFLRTMLDVKPVVEELDRETLIVITDTHIGVPSETFYTNKELLRAAIAYIKTLKMKNYDILCDGDNLEGNLMKLKYDLSRGTDQGNVYRLADWLVRSKGILKDSAQYNGAIDQFELRLARSMPITNIDIQAQTFVNEVLPIAKTAKTFITVSGNHVSGTYQNFEGDEATKIANMIEPQIKQAKVIRVEGGRYGFCSDVKINGKPFVIAHRGGPDAVLNVTRNGFVGPQLYGDSHHFRVDRVGTYDNHSTVVVVTPAMKDPTPFDEQNRVTGALRGFNILNFDYKPGGKDPVVSSVRFVSLSELEARGFMPEVNPLITEFKAALRESNHPTEKVRMVTA